MWPWVASRDTGALGPAHRPSWPVTPQQPLGGQVAAVAQGGRDSRPPRDGRTLGLWGLGRHRSLTRRRLCSRGVSRPGWWECQLCRAHAPRCEPSGLPGFLPIQKTPCPPPPPRRPCRGRPEGSWEWGSLGAKSQRSTPAVACCSPRECAADRQRSVLPAGPERPGSPSVLDREKRLSPWRPCGDEAPRLTRPGAGARHPGRTAQSTQLSPRGQDVGRLFSPRPGRGPRPWSRVCPRRA